MGKKNKQILEFIRGDLNFPIVNFPLSNKSITDSS
jgi:hypothetical protein